MNCIHILVYQDFCNRGVPSSLLAISNWILKNTVIFLIPGQGSQKKKKKKNKQNIKMSFLFEDKQFFLFLCLRTSKILSLGEFDELKSHLFLVHFSV